MNIAVNPFWPRLNIRMKGGDPAPPPPPTPPVTERSTEVTAASRQTRIDASKRKGYQATLLAGETGGYQEQGGQKTLLGS